MEAADRKRDYLAKAREAEEHAGRTVDSVMRDTWLKIAQSYRELAEVTQRDPDNGIYWEQTLGPQDLPQK